MKSTHQIGDLLLAVRMCQKFVINEFLFHQVFCIYGFSVSSFAAHYSLLLLYFLIMNLQTLSDTTFFFPYLSCSSSFPIIFLPFFSALKYSTAVPVIFLSALKYHVFPDQWTNIYRPLWLLSSLVNSSYSFYWDVTRDWDMRYMIIIIFWLLIVVIYPCHLCFPNIILTWYLPPCIFFPSDKMYCYFFNTTFDPLHFVFNACTVRDLSPSVRKSFLVHSLGLFCAFRYVLVIYLFFNHVPVGSLGSSSLANCILSPTCYMEGNG